MSNYLTKPYEISLWKDGPSGSEVKICTIGSHNMKGQSRAFEPLFSRNVNGVKKLSFKIYKKYVDIQTGEEVDNPYMGYLISERKVKLHLPEEPAENQWHDFIIKNVSENSATHLCTYQLEDALVQELSKNGFGVTLDTKLMNNIGTANGLAEFVLRETNWGVSSNSEAFVQTIDEALVYVTFPRNPSGLSVYKITGQKESNRKIGVTAALTSLEGLKGKTILAFYSSCTGKPHRFQFLYSANGYNTEEELSNYISNDTDYQYYIEFNNPETAYTVETQGFSLPEGFSLTTVSNSVLCTSYRGRRYGFSQQAKYIPVLNRYVQLYKKGNQEYYGYEHAKYKSPALTQNMISNSTFESTSGWTGTKNSGSGEKAEVEAVYGYFSGGEFVSAIDELKNGTFNPKSDDNPEGNDYKAYLKLNFKDVNSTVINSGPFDNRTLIGNMVVGDEWALDYICLDETGKSVKDTLWHPQNPLTFSLGEYKYFSGIDGYSEINYSEDEEYEKISFSEPEDKDDYQVFTVQKDQGRDGHEYSNESFGKKMNVRLQISAQGTYYLEKIELFKVAYYNNHIIPLEEQISKEGDDSYKPLEDRTVEKTYYYFTEDAIKDITNAEQLKPEAREKTLSYTTYKPVYNEGAQKVRTVTVKESNYFNILQSIAETFEAWLTFDIGRNNDGGIISKKIAFKNYVGGNNYACFRCGVNLKDIQRTFESKNIVTKLVVKNNSNEYANGGFCTIQRASANPTGENYIYDFQYFFNQGLMEARDYLDTLYVINGATGPDHSIWTNGVNSGVLNLQGYFPRIKALNNKIQTESELLNNIFQDLTQYKADLVIAETGLDAATSGIEQTREEFLLLAGAPIDMLSTEYITSIAVGNKKDTEEEAKENGGWYYANRDWINTVSLSQTGNTIEANITVKEPSSSEHILYIKVYPLVTLSKDGRTVELSQYYNIKCTVEANATSGSGGVDIEIVNSSRNDVQKKLQEYAVHLANEKKYTPEKTKLQEQVDALEAQYNTKRDYIENSLKDWKRQLNQLFFQTYSRFIQEGTWISEEYVDDGLYYADAQSVMYNSCYPQVAYTINVISVEGLPGYEDFKYKLGEKTWVIDPEFFGDEEKEPVIITEIAENLDDRSKNQIKVQNFKNQFQDLFQKITATVQQAQYNTGSYEKAVALAEANQERKQQFLTDALDSASARLSTAGQQSVTWGNDGITVKSVNSPNDAIRMVGGAILLSKQDKNGQQKWVTGVTSDGVSASLITAGVLNTGEISIMNYDEPVFRWDSFGISAYDATWYNGGANVGTVISGVNTKKFVRFDKHGIYGINDADVDGANWYPGQNGDKTAQEEIEEKANFYLTWDGLGVTGRGGGVAKIGRQYNPTTGKNYIFVVKQKETDENNKVVYNDTFRISENGGVEIGGDLFIGKIKDGNTVTDYVENAAEDVYDRALGDAKQFAQLANAELKEEISKDIDETASEINRATNALIEATKKELMDQIDGSIMTYFEPGVPTLDNYPAKDWIDDSEKEKHLGDLYYDTNTQFCYRWTSRNEKDENGQEIVIYEWVIVADTDVSLALQAAAKAQATADGKMCVFYGDHPTPPYNIGDIWVNANYGNYTNDLLRCVQQKSQTDMFDIKDWVLATRYTDDAAVEALGQEFNIFKDGYVEFAGNIQSQIDKKAETWYQSEDPQSGWTGEEEKHLGDLWHDTTDNTEYIYSENDTGYYWEEMEVPDIVFNKIDGKSNIFTSLPNGVQINEGDILIPSTNISNGGKTYVKGKVYRYVIPTGQQQGVWTAIEYTDDSALTNFITGVYSQETELIKQSIDKKAEIYYLPYDPSTDNWGESNVGDLWRCTADIEQVDENGDSRIIRKANSEWVWTDDGQSGYAWHEMEIPNNIFDAYDGKATLYTSLPGNEYHANDLWILSEQDAKSDYCPMNGTAKYTAGTLLIAINNCPRSGIDTYQKTDWIEKTKYLDEERLNQAIEDFSKDYAKTADLDKIQEQLDQKAETWYQPNDPSKEWAGDDEDHVGDLWYCTEEIKENGQVVRRKNSEWIWQEDSGTYLWKEMEIDVPDVVFDSIDKKSSIFVVPPIDTSTIHPGDVLIPTSDSSDPKDEDKIYYTGKVYRWASPGVNEELQWLQVEYTDDTLAEEAKKEAQDASKTANDAKDLANDAMGLAGGAIPKVSTGNEFEWKFDPSYGVRMYNTVNSKEVDTFRIYKAEGSEEYIAWIRGHVIAETGQIGTMTIGDLNSKLVGKNWIVHSDIAKRGGEGNPVTYDLEKTFNKYDSSMCTVSFELKVEQWQNNLLVIAIPALRSTLGYYETQIENKTGEFVKYRVSFPTLLDNINVEENKQITFYSPTYYTIRNVKLEKGETATEWCSSQEDNLQNDVNNNFSWRFSPTEGMFMYKGNQSTDPLLKIDATGLTVNGTINATQGGEIGGFTINPHKWLEYKKDNSCCGMGVYGEAYAFWAGKYTTTIPGENSPFRVGHDGKLYATGATITGVIDNTKLKIEDSQITFYNNKPENINQADGARITYNSTQDRLNISAFRPDGQSGGVFISGGGSSIDLQKDDQLTFNSGGKGYYFNSGGATFVSGIKATGFSTYSGTGVTKTMVLQYSDAKGTNKHYTLNITISGGIITSITESSR